ncbi:MAG TPA: sigma factor [Solirubrobacteraceae bacterium]|nr:sigma factor [Solirubrobacteraceae bacterium]
MSELDDAALVRIAQTGDPIGLGVLLERHRARLHAVALAMLGHGPDAEDAVQETFVIALQRIGELREPAAAGAWLTTVQTNVCRARRRRPDRELAPR